MIVCNKNYSNENSRRSVFLREDDGPARGLSRRGGLA